MDAKQLMNHPLKKFATTLHTQFEKILTYDDYVMDCDVSMDKIMRMPIFQLNYFIEQAEMRHYYVALTTRNGEIYTGKIQLLRNRQKVLVHKPNKNVIRYINLHDIYYVSRQD